MVRRMKMLMSRGSVLLLLAAVMVAGSAQYVTKPQRAATCVSGGVTRIKMTPAPIATFGSLQAGQSANFSALALNGTTCDAGATISLNVSGGPGTVFVPSSQCFGRTQLGSSSIQCVTDSTGNVAMTFTVPNVLPAQGSVEVNAQAGGASDHDWYVYEYVLVFNPSPIATSGSLTASQSVPITLQVTAPLGTPINGQQVWLSFSTTASPAGSAWVGTTQLTGSAQLFATDVNGQIALRYVAPSSLSSGGADTIRAASSTGSAPPVASFTSYAFQAGYPTLSVGDVSQIEGDNHPDVLAEFNVTLSAPQPNPVTVVYNTICGTGDKTCKEDYLQALPGGTVRSVTIPAGQVRGQINIRVYSYSANESYDETFFVQLAMPTGAILGRSLGKGTIIGDDETTLNEILYVGDTAVVRSTTGNQYAEFTVTLSSPSGSPVTFDYATTDGTAVAGTDYFAESGTATIAAGLSSLHIQVPILPSTTAGSPYFTVTISNPSGAAIERATGTGTVL
jgi:hypothetical protein